ncbi:MAG: 2-succinyl-5-enolpyruvyl-6-hydroxy-3-cyclohexene-1-carboxylic-acid synthase [Gemmatimonadetes bacterium]|nr:MAG: 2-succinyl-5-enolpyruvyl-6-hydroxy-3-cyclohexene-1-carboxylic-acid synthase [Gemmatimonadota bacterium]
MIDTTSFNTVWASLLVEELLRTGIRYFCISPGSRSTPLTVAVAKHPHTTAILAYDERSAAFHALGYARATGTSAVLICTSGTAAANYLPAVVEADVDTVPLLIFSADRPPELRETGANQTIRQPAMFGDRVRWQFDLPCPDIHIPPQMVLTTIDQAVYRAHRPPAGPVHLNCMFREPLAPQTEPVPAAYLEGLTRWQSTTTPYTRYDPPQMVPPEAPQCAVSAHICNAKQPLIIVGRLSKPDEQKAVLTLIEHLRLPAVVDVLSGLRWGVRSEHIIPYVDQQLLIEQPPPDLVLHLGGEFTSKRLAQFLEASPPQHRIVVKPHPFRHDPTHHVTHRIECDLIAFCEHIISRIAPQNDSSHWKTQSERVKVILDQFVANQESLNEIMVAHLISRYIPAGHGLFVSSSMPIRDLDMYATTDGVPVRIAANRGASGIDGTIASATGFSAGLEAPVTLITGDLAFLHDLNSLSLIDRLRQPVIIILINNQGGGIFSFLPIANHPDVFEPYFGTPHHLTFRHVSENFGLRYQHPRTRPEFITCYQNALKQGQSTVIEVRTTRAENVALHRQLQASIISHLTS